MTRTRIALLSAALGFSASAFAGSPAGSTRIESPLVGHWVLDVGSLPMPPEARPKHVELVFRTTDDGKWSSRVEITEQSGNVKTSESTLSLDGTPEPATGSYEVDTISAKMPRADVLVMQLVFEGFARSSRVYTLSEDGKVMTETEAYAKPDGTPILRLANFTRAADRVASAP